MSEVWNKFTKSANDDETVSNTFCTSDIFRISGDEMVKNHPNVQAFLQNEKVAIAIDTNLFLLKDIAIMECDILNFGSRIDTLIMSVNGELIICCLQNGNVHGVHISGSHIFDLCVQPEDIGEHQTFVGINYVNVDYLIMCSNGKVYKLSNINLKEISDIIINSTTIDETINDSKLDAIKIECVSAAINTNIISFCALKCYPNDYSVEDELTVNGENHQLKNKIIASSENTLYFLNSPHHDLSKIILPSHFNGIKKILDLEHIIIGLTNSGVLLKICPYTHLIFKYPENDVPIEDVIYMENNDSELELLILTKIMDEIRLLKIIDFPSMTVKYELKMPSSTWLTQQSKSSVQIYYLSGDHFTEEFVQAIDMKIISETQPSERLIKLIQRGHFEEAENFAQQFKLSLQPIYLAKIRKNVFEISSISPNNISLLEEKFEAFLELLNLCNNTDFLLSIRNMEIPDRNLMKRFLEYLVQKIQSNKYETESNEILECLLRLETLNLIDPYESNLEWLTFVRHPNLIGVCIKMFNSEDMSKACLIWKQHASTLVPNLSSGAISKILNDIPNFIEPFHVIQWLKHFVPNIIQIHPSSMTLIISWSIERMKLLKSSELWPEIGREFINNILLLFSEITIVLEDEHRLYDINIAKLENLKCILDQITTLKKIYNLTLVIDIDDYLNNTLEENASLILQHVHYNNLENLIKTFVIPLFIDRGLSPANSIIRYVNFVVRNRINFWQERAIIALEQLCNEEDKLKCVLLVLKSSQVPWSQPVQSLYKYTKSSHPLSHDIFTEYELQRIKLIKLKNGWRIYEGCDCNDMLMLIRRIIKLRLPDMHEDIKEVIKTYSNIREQANFYCCNELAAHGYIDDAVKHFNSLSKIEQINCYSKIVNITQLMLVDNTLIESNLMNIIEFLKYVSEKYEEIDGNNLDDLLKMEIFKKHFNHDLIINFNEKPFKIKYLENCIKIIIDNILEAKGRNKLILQQSWNKINLLSYLLSIDKIIISNTLLAQLCNLTFSCAIARLVLDEISSSKINPNNTKHFIELAVILMTQQIETVQQDGHLNLFPIAFPLAHKLLTRVMNESVFYYDEISELMIWTRIGNLAFNLGDVEKFIKDMNNLDKDALDDSINLSDSNRRSMDLFDSATNAESSKYQNNPEPVITCLSYAIKYLCAVLNKDVLPFNRFHKYMKNLGTTAEISGDFMVSLEHLIKIKHYSIGFIIIETIMKFQKYRENVLIPESMLDVIYRKILKCALSQRELNFIDAVGILASNKRSEQMIQHLTDKFRSGQSKLNLLTLLEFYQAFYGNSNTTTDISQSRLAYYYYLELCKTIPSFKGKFNELIDFSMEKLFSNLPTIYSDVKLLKKISNDFNWDYQEVLICQVINLLNSQELKFEIVIDNNCNNNETILIKKTEDDLRKLCQPFINQITNSDLFVKKLLKFFDKINFYYYELYLYVLDILRDNKALTTELQLYSNILEFLKYKMTVKRFTVGQIETESWLKSQENNGILPKISKYRFPFNLIIQSSLDLILGGEINVNNCEKWFPLMELHAMLFGKHSMVEINELKDRFCMTAVKNSISEYKSNNDTEMWNLIPIHNAFLQSILRLVTNMKDSSRILMILYFISIQAPEGADQVEAAYECYKFTIANETELKSNPRALDTIDKIKRKYPIFKIQHLLRVYHLKDEKLLQLVENPIELINALYSLDCILSSNCIININQIAQEVADLYKLNFHSIQMSLIKKWLAISNDCNRTDADETYYEDLDKTMTGNAENSDTNNEFILRAHYVLKSWSPEQSVSTLISYIYPIEGSSNTTQQLQVVACFMKLVDENLPIYEDLIKEQYVVLKCVHNLRNFGFNFSIEKFKNYDKVTILKKIWQDYANDEKALELMSCICIGFDIHLQQIWNGILKQMIKLDMIQHLSSIIELLSVNKTLLHIDGLVLVWEYLILRPFKNAIKIHTPDEDVLLCKSLFILQSCPLKSKINLLPLFEHCLRIERIDLAAILIAFAKDVEKENFIKIITNHKTNTLKQEIMNLEEFGIFPFITNFVINQLNL